VVRALRHCHGAVALERLRGRRAVRQHLDVDTGLVHFLEADFAKVIESIRDARIALDAGGLRRQLRIPVMLLDRDDRTFRLLQHGANFPVRYGTWFLAMARIPVTAACRVTSVLPECPAPHGAQPCLAPGPLAEVVIESLCE